MHVGKTKQTSLGNYGIGTDEEGSGPNVFMEESDQHDKLDKNAFWTRVQSDNEIL